MPMKPKEILIAARARIADPEHWIKGHMAEDTIGNEVCTDHVNAYRFCAVGALKSVLHKVVKTHKREFKLNEYLSGKLMSYIESKEFKGVPDFNDSPNTTHADVLAMFDKAIASCP